MNFAFPGLLFLWSRSQQEVPMTATTATKPKEGSVKRDGDNAKPANNTRKAKITEEQEKLVQELTAHYGVEYTGDKDQFITDCVKESHRRAKQPAQDDPGEEGRYDEKLGRLRRQWTVGDETRENKKVHDDIRKQLEDLGIQVTLTFNDDGTWYMTSGGQEDSGSGEDANTIISAAKRLTNYEE